MSISGLFIRRPVMTALIMAAILIFGLLGYRNLPVSDLPNVDFPTLLVTAALPGASPETMASAVALPLERQFSTIAGVDSMTSVNTLGLTSITLQFTLSRNIDAAAQDVQAMISKSLGQLPVDMPAPPSYQKVNPADQPIIYLALSSPTLKLSDVNNYADTLIAPRLSTLSGVAQVQVFGAQKYAVRVQLDPDALAARGIGIDEVTAAIAAGNVELPTGTLWGRHHAFTINTSGQLLAAAGYQDLIVAYKNGAPVRLSDVGTAIDSVENDKTASWYNGTRAIVMAVLRQPGTNTVAVVDNIKALLPTFREQMPAAVDLSIIYDRSVAIRSSVADVKFTLILTVGLVVMVIFLFLRNLRATFIPSLALPMSIIGTFAAMYVLGFTIDTLSLMALTLSVGFVVDDAIVMLENIIRHVEQGEPVAQAALVGSKEIGFTIVSMTMSLVAVFIPVLFLGGILGRLLREFAVTISMAILVSGFVSLSLTPMLCHRFLKPHAQVEAGHSRLFNWTEAVFAAMLRGYDLSLAAVLRHRFATLMVGLAVLIGSGVLFWKIPMGFLPSVDTGQIFAFTEAAQGISYEAMVDHQKMLAAIVHADPNVDGFISAVGGAGASNTGRIFMRLKPRDQRKLDADHIIAELRPKAAGVPGINMFMQNLPLIRIGGQLTKSLYQFTLQSPDTDTLYHYAPLLEEKLRALPDLQDVTSDLQIKNLEEEVELNRDQASALGVDATRIEESLYSAYGDRQISTMFAPNNQYKVIVGVAPRFQREPSLLSKLYVRAQSGSLVPLEYLTRITTGVGPLSVNHLGQLPAVTISFNLRPGAALGDAVKEVKKISAQVLPQTITTSFQGQAQAFQSSTQGLWVLLVMAVVVIYLVLGILYESFIHPLTILSGLPAAGFGALLTLMIFHKELNIYAFVGVIMLVGIVKKNAIMMVDFALEAQRREGKPAIAAVHEGALVRFRPIMMTTMAAMMGALPIALGIGASSDANRPLGMAVVGGLLFSQVLTLYLTPVIYSYLDRFAGTAKVAEV